MCGHVIYMMRTYWVQALGKQCDQCTGHGQHPCLLRTVGSGFQRLPAVSQPPIFLRVLASKGPAASLYSKNHLGNLKLMQSPIKSGWGEGCSEPL